MAQYNIKVEKQADASYLIGLGVTDDTSPAATAKTYVWKRYPAGIPPTGAQVKADFTAQALDGNGKPIVGSSLKEQLDAQLANILGAVTPVDMTPMVPVQDAQGNTVQVPQKVSFP